MTATTTNNGVRHLLSLASFSRQELMACITRAAQLKKEARAGLRHRQLDGKIVALVFDKPSTRTRVSFEAAMYGLGGQVIFMSSRETQLSRSEPLKDMARVMSRYVDGMVIRTFGQEIVEELARHASVPVINALTDLHHPCQILSDLMTVLEHKPVLAGLKVAWVGDGNNMANSWIEAAGVMGFSLALACPPGYEPDAGIIARARLGTEIFLDTDPAAVVRDADVVNTDVWTSMGQESETGARNEIFRPYSVTHDLLSLARGDAIVLHCLPAHRGEEISDEVLEGPQCVAFDQAENKMHIHKAILESHLGG